MGLGQLIDRIRELTLEALTTAVTRHRGDGTKVLAERALCDAEGNPVVEGELGLPTRVDLVVLESDTAPTGSVMVDTARMLSFDPLSFEWAGGLSVRLEPFQWDWCGLRLEGLPASPDWGALTAWFMRWFERETGETPFSGVVHFLSDPASPQPGAATFSLDFGTAPAQAFEELLDAVGKTGATRVTVGQPEASK